MTIKKAFDNFIYTKRLSGVNENTIRNYNATLSLMLKHWDDDLELASITYELVTDYIMHVMNKPISKSTKSSYIRNIRIFLRWVYVEYGLPFNPEKIKVPKSPKKNVHIYTNDELLTIFKAVETSVPWITARNRSIIAFMLDSGLRQHEVCNLLKVDIDTERMIMKITGKGAKDRLVPLGSLTYHLMNEYLELCPYKDLKTVFADRRGNVLSTNAIRLFVSRTEKKLNFSLSSHKLRHNFATNYCIDHIEQTGNSNVYDLGILMGHESIETTKRYEHFAHELIASKNSISHLDTCLGNNLIELLKSG